MRYRPIILTADDSETFTMYFSLILTRMGFDVIPTSSGNDAIKLSKTFAPDLIILDLNIPELNGLETLKIIKTDPQINKTPIVIMSVKPAINNKNICLQLGACDYLEKPINIVELHHVIQKCLSSANEHKRENLRSSCNETVEIEYNNKKFKRKALTLSEGGVFVKEKKPLEVNSLVNIRLFLKEKEPLKLKGKVIYIKGIYQDGIMRTVPGMAIGFYNVPSAVKEILRAHILSYLIEDIIEETEDAIVSL